MYGNLSGIAVGTISAKTATNAVLAGERCNKTPIHITGVYDAHGFWL